MGNQMSLVVLLIVDAVRVVLILEMVFSVRPRVHPSC